MNTVETWNDIVDNCYQFNYAAKDRNSIPFRRFSQFFHWYYFPQFRLFAPSKFIGYKDTKADDYIGDGSGTETNQILKKYFIKLERNSRQFKDLRNELERFAKPLGKKLNVKTFQGSGGIYIPKTQFVKNEDVYTLLLYNTVSKDIEYQKEEIDLSPELEGAKKEKLVSYYERNPKLRARAISYHGLSCKVCGFDFETFYGEWGKNYIEVHHLKPISSVAKETNINPQEDMTVLCSNCHRMVHRKKNDPISLDDLKKNIKK